jgi:hypothetical protein
MPVKLGFSSVKTGVRSVVGNYWIHGGKYNNTTRISRMIIEFTLLILYDYLIRANPGQ